LHDRVTRPNAPNVPQGQFLVDGPFALGQIDIGGEFWATLWGRSDAGTTYAAEVRLRHTAENTYLIVSSSALVYADGWEDGAWLNGRTINR